MSVQDSCVLWGDRVIIPEAGSMVGNRVEYRNKYQSNTSQTNERMNDRTSVAKRMNRDKTRRNEWR